jgi:hypothetical protein
MGVIQLNTQNTSASVGGTGTGKIHARSKARPILLQFFVTLSIMLMFFGSLLLPSTHIGSQARPLAEELQSDSASRDYTPWVNDRFIFPWSPIDPLYEQEDNEDDYGWGMRNEAGQRDNDRMPGVSRYGDSFISDMGVLMISSYDWDNHIQLILRDGFMFTDAFQLDYPYNLLDFTLITVYNGVDLTKTKTCDWPINVDCDYNDDAYHQTMTGAKCYAFDLNPKVALNEIKLQLPPVELKSVMKMNRNNEAQCTELPMSTSPTEEGYELSLDGSTMTVRAKPVAGWTTAIEINFMHYAFTCDENDQFRTIGKYPEEVPYTPHLQHVTDKVLWEGDLSPSGGASRYDGRILYTTRDLWLWGGTIEMLSSGRSMVLRSTIAEGYIDKNGNGIPDLADDCDGGYVLGQGYTNGNGGGDDQEVAHGIDTAWFSCVLTGDAVWGFYGSEFFGFVHRDLMISSYDDNNHISITDMSDGDDTREVTLDAWEDYMAVNTFVEDTWCAGDDAGDSYELQSYGLLSNTDWTNKTQAATAMNSPMVKRAIDSGNNFEADWVLIKSDKPVTIFGGMWDNNWHTEAFGPRGSQYLVPFSQGMTITGLAKEAHVVLDFQDTNEGDKKLTIEPGAQWTYESMGCCPFSNNYVGEIVWVEIRSDQPIRVELWQANDDNAFDNCDMVTFRPGFDYYPAEQKWDVAIHHRAIIYITALEDDTTVGWTGTWVNSKPLECTLSKYQFYRVVMDEDENYDGCNDDDTQADNEDELEGDIQMMTVSADKDVMVNVRYNRDYSCEPHDMELAISINPTIQTASTEYPYFLPLLISSIMVTDLALVGTGRRGIAGVLGLVHRIYPMPKRLGK